MSLKKVKRGARKTAQQRKKGLCLISPVILRNYVEVGRKA